MSIGIAPSLSGYMTVVKVRHYPTERLPFRIDDLLEMIRRYFRPTNLPATVAGPSPNQVRAGCTAATIRLVLLGILVVALLFAVFHGILTEG